MMSYQEIAGCQDGPKVIRITPVVRMGFTCKARKGVTDSCGIMMLIGVEAKTNEGLVFTFTQSIPSGIIVGCIGILTVARCRLVGLHLVRKRIEASLKLGIKGTKVDIFLT